MWQYIRSAQIKAYGVKILWWSGEHVFWAFLGLFAIATVLSVLLFLWYVAASGGGEADSVVPRPMFDEAAMNNLLLLEEERRGTFVSIPAGSARNIFAPFVVQPNEQARELTEE
jgi:hypothetical protein